MKLVKHLDRITRKKTVGTFSDAILLTATFYLTLRRFFENISISHLLRQHLLNETGIKLYFFISGLLLIAAFLVKLIQLITKLFPHFASGPVEPKMITECLLRSNQEIDSHLLSIQEHRFQLTDLPEHHKFDENIRLVINALSEHIAMCGNDVRVPERNLLISVYTIDNYMQLPSTYNTLVYGASPHCLDSFRHRIS